MIYKIISMDKKWKGMLIGKKFVSIPLLWILITSPLFNGNYPWVIQT